MNMYRTNGTSAKDGLHYSIIAAEGTTQIATGSKHQDIPISNFHIFRPIAESWMGGDHTLEISLELDRHRLQLLEEQRIHDLNLNIRGTATVALYNTSKSQQSTQIQHILKIIKADLEMKATIPQSHWVKNILPDLGWGDFIILEVPVGGKPLTSSWEYLNKAQNAFDNWDTESLAANARNLVKNLTMSLAQKLGKEHPAYRFNWRRAANKEKKDVFSVALHEVDLSEIEGYDITDVKFKRADAEFALNYARILMKYAQELYERKRKEL
jgi:hypothetical protein